MSRVCVPSSCRVEYPHDAFSRHCSTQPTVLLQYSPKHSRHCPTTMRPKFRRRLVLGNISAVNFRVKKYARSSLQKQATTLKPASRRCAPSHDSARWMMCAFARDHDPQAWVNLQPLGTQVRKKRGHLLPHKGCRCGCVTRHGEADVKQLGGAANGILQAEG
jgi:hypothetical protein